MADGFVWYELVTDNLDKAVTFYSEVVGWDMRDSGAPGMRYMIFAKNGKDVGGMMTWAAEDAVGMRPEWMAHIHTAKLDQELRAVVADGGTIIKPAQHIPQVGRFAVVLDPQGVKYLLFEPSSNYARPRLGQMETGNVGWHELLTHDAEQSFEYYSKHYGWEKDYAHDMGSMGIYQTFRTDKPLYAGGMMNLRSCPSIGDGLKPHWKLFFTVDDIEAAQNRIRLAGGAIAAPPMDVPGGSWVLQALDDQGCPFALMQPPRQ
jgi:uncharacterized protein